MIEGLIGVAIATEVARVELNMQKIADGFYTKNISERVVKYRIETRGDIKGDKEEFRKVVAETLRDEKGWARAGVKFEEVEKGGELKMILASPKKVAEASAGCSDKLSCTVKSDVLINDDRWMGGSDSYNQLGVKVAEYRQMVINHEVGHFLGHDHIAKCEIENGTAPIMLQQSTGLRGCQPGVWPMPNELWVKR
ncbi:DUF3152 domain-containing protein [Candidatus Saccharibacteria bacterium]|nr:DUF3152 domain-containing protein [Candidatus Saccharibacteria bacterium]